MADGAVFFGPGDADRIRRTVARSRRHGPEVGRRRWVETPTGTTIRHIWCNSTNTDGTSGFYPARIHLFDAEQNGFQTEGAECWLIGANDEQLQGQFYRGLLCGYASDGLPVFITACCQGEATGVVDPPTGTGTGYGFGDCCDDPDLLPDEVYLDFLKSTAGRAICDVSASSLTAYSPGDLIFLPGQTIPGLPGGIGGRYTYTCFDDTTHDTFDAGVTYTLTKSYQPITVDPPTGWYYYEATIANIRYVLRPCQIFGSAGLLTWRLFLYCPDATLPFWSSDTPINYGEDGNSFPSDSFADCPETFDPIFSLCLTGQWLFCNWPLEVAVGGFRGPDAVRIMT